MNPDIFIQTQIVCKILDYAENFILYVYQKIFVKFVFVCIFFIPKFAKMRILT